MESEPLAPFQTGDLALRFRIEYIGFRRWHDLPQSRYCDTRPAVRGLEVVKVLSQEGETVTWTNCKKRRASGPDSDLFVSRSNRRELIALKFLESILPGSLDSCAVPITADSETSHPAAPASPLQR